MSGFQSEPEQWIDWVIIDKFNQRKILMVYTFGNYNNSTGKFEPFFVSWIKNLANVINGRIPVGLTINKHTNDANRKFVKKMIGKYTTDTGKRFCGPNMTPSYLFNSTQDEKYHCMFITEMVSGEERLHSVVTFNLKKDSANKPILYIDALCAADKPYVNNNGAWRLLSLVYKVCKRLGIRRIDLESIPTTPTMNFYRKEGFKPNTTITKPTGNLKPLSKVVLPFSLKETVNRVIIDNRISSKLTEETNMSVDEEKIVDETLTDEIETDKEIVKNAHGWTPEYEKKLNNTMPFFMDLRTELLKDPTTFSYTLAEASATEPMATEPMATASAAKAPMAEPMAKAPAPMAKAPAPMAKAKAPAAKASAEEPLSRVMSIEIPVEPSADTKWKNEGSHNPENSMDIPDNPGHSMDIPDNPGHSMDVPYETEDSNNPGHSMDVPRISLVGKSKEQKNKLAELIKWNDSDSDSSTASIVKPNGFLPIASVYGPPKKAWDRKSENKLNENSFSFFNSPEIQQESVKRKRGEETNFLIEKKGKRSESAGGKSKKRKTKKNTGKRRTLRKKRGV